MFSPSQCSDNRIRIKNANGISFRCRFCSFHPVLEPVHSVRPATSVRLHTENAIERGSRNIHTEPGAAEFCRQPHHILLVLHSYLQISQVQSITWYTIINYISTTIIIIIILIYHVNGARDTKKGPGDVEFVLNILPGINGQNTQQTRKNS